MARSRQERSKNEARTRVELRDEESLVLGEAVLFARSLQVKNNRKACESEKFYCVLQTFQEKVVSLWSNIDYSDTNT